MKYKEKALGKDKLRWEVDRSSYRLEVGLANGTIIRCTFLGFMYCRSNEIGLEMN